MVTGGTEDVAADEATLSGSYSGETGTITETGFEYGTSSSLGRSVSSGSTSASFSAVVTGLTASTTYYYRAYAKESVGGVTSTRYGTTKTFTTLPGGGSGGDQPSGYQTGWLASNEVPAIPTLNGSTASGTNSGRDDKWTRYYTTDSKVQVAVHTFTHPTTGKTERNFIVYYDESKYSPIWVASVMHSGMYPDNSAGRSGSWAVDPAIDLDQYDSVDGYSRGHMVASNDRQSTKNQNQQTFYYTNKAAQYQNKFNDGVWNQLEQAIQGSAPSGRDTLYVVTGVLYEGTVTTKTSGEYVVPIPSHFYKCLMKCSFDTNGTMTAAKGVAYVYTNEAHSGVQYNNSQFLSTIDDIEARAGFDFFPNVPKTLQDAAESSKASIW